TVSNGINLPVSQIIDFTVDSTAPGAANLYFSAFPGPNNGGNPVLYTLDANLDPVPVNTPNGQSAGEHGGFFQYNGDLYFNADAPSPELVKLDSSGTVTPVVETSDSSQSFSNLGIDASFTEFAGRLYFRTAGLGEIDPDGTAKLITVDPNEATVP